MCRNIRLLFNFAPPVTDAEVRAAALQYVRKISGFNKPSKANEAAFLAAVENVAAVSATLLHSLMSLGLQAAIDKWSGIAWTAMLGETAINAVAAYLAFLTIEALPGAMSRGRTRQRSAWGRRQW